MPPVQPLAAGDTGRRSLAMARDVNGRRRENIRLALILGVVALGFFVLGMYLATGKG